MRCFNRIDRKRCRGEIERGMTNCHECGCGLEGIWAQLDILTSPGAGLPPPKRRPKFGQVQRLGKRIKTWAGVELPKPALAMGFAHPAQEDASAASANAPTGFALERKSTMDVREIPLRRLEHWQGNDGQPKDLGEVWRLTKNGRVVRCLLVGHPVGQEARVEIDGESLPFTQVCKTTKDVADVTSGWRSGFEAKGWREDRT